MLLKVVCALQLGQQPLGSASLAIEAGGAGALQHSSTGVARPTAGAGRPAAAVDPCDKASGRRAAVGRRRREENGGCVGRKTEVTSSV